MYLPQSYWVATCLMLLTMLCWGSWANTQKLTGTHWRFELFYWDYSIGLLLGSIFFALILGQGTGTIFTFTASLIGSDLSHVYHAFLSGAIFNIANFLLVAAIALAGMAVAFPIGVGIALILGTVINEWLHPVTHPYLLGAGCILILMAILLDAKAYRMITEQVDTMRKGLIVAVVSGVLLGLFYPLVAESMKGYHALDPYAASVVFSIGVFACNLFFNIFMMRRPVLGEPLNFKSYCAGTLKQHALGIVGGMIWSLGMSCNLLAANTAGPAIAFGMGQGATMIAAIWGVFVWREFKQAKGIKPLLYTMFGSYVGGLVLIGFSH